MSRSHTRMIGAFLAATMSLASSLAPAESPERNVYYGDLHLHTSYSTDAVFLSGIRVGLDDAYRFARGESVDYAGQPLRRAEPLDFIAVTDHAEQMGLGRQLFEEKGPLADAELGRKLRAGGRATPAEVGSIFNSKQPIPGVDVTPILVDAWQQQKDAAQRYYAPGVFTTFLAYEWSASPDMQNLHRNVIFRGTDAPLPFSAADSPRPEDLWTYLEENRARGVEALAIPHNADVSNGIMYGLEDSDGEAFDASYARRRAINEPLSEIYQSKGQSETHPLLSPPDEYARFELFEFLMGTTRLGKTSGSYVREAWGRGLAIAAKTGENPFSFGVVGATDLHNGLADTRESTYRGPGLAGDLPKQEVAVLLGQVPNPHPVIPLVTTGSGGLTGIWAEENTRESLYDGLRRKETFATSGTRIALRAFGGWGYPSDLMSNGKWVDIAQRHGTAMGGTLPSPPTGAPAPQIAVVANMDTKGAKLERLQVIKVWLGDGGPAEKIFDVAVAKGGASSLQALWTDPSFDRARPALYYIRVLELATPRWSTLLAREKGLPLPKEVPETIQERAWSSPIWYTPSTGNAAERKKSGQRSAVRHPSRPEGSPR